VNGPSSGTQFNIWELVPETDGRHRRPLRQTNPDQRFLFQESVPVISDWPHDGGLDGPNRRRFLAPSQVESRFDSSGNTAFLTIESWFVEFHFYRVRIPLRTRKLLI